MKDCVKVASHKLVNGYHEFRISFSKGVGMVKWVKWTIRAEHKVVFLLLSLLWGLSEDVLYLDNYAVLFCFLSIDMFVFFTRHSLRYFSELRYFIHQIVVIVQSLWHSLPLRNYLIVLARRLTLAGMQYTFSILLNN